MAMGRRDAERQQDLFITTDQHPKSIGHMFYLKLNDLLAEAGFDAWVEKLCEKRHAKKIGRPGIAFGIYFRMLFIGYFEGIQSPRGIAWRCVDSLSLRRFLGIPRTSETPDHSSLSYMAAEIYHGDQADVTTLEDGVNAAQTYQRVAGSDTVITDVVADTGYHSAIVERTFAYLLETGGVRRTWLCGIDKVRKRYSLAAAAYNLSVLMRTLFGIGTPRGLQQLRMALEAALSRAQLAYLALWRPITTIWNRQTFRGAKSY